MLQGCGSSFNHNSVNHKAIAGPKEAKPGVRERASKTCKEFNECLPARKKANKSDRNYSSNANLLFQLKTLASEQIRSLLSNGDKSWTKK